MLKRLSCDGRIDGGENVCDRIKKVQYWDKVFGCRGLLLRRASFHSAVLQFFSCLLSDLLQRSVF
jgi:hypothetical protein